MQLGIVFGGFCPLHQGHLDLIMKAKKETDKTLVIVCGYDNEPRGEIIGLTVMQRYRLIKNFLEDEILKVDMINDTELGLDESMSDNNWKAWTTEIYSKIKKNFEILDITELVWYVAEEKYQENLIKNSQLKSLTKASESVILIDRTINDISGTKCRDNPIKYWDKICLPFRESFSHNILIAGTASEGKSTLCRDIGNYFGIPYSYEKGRDICQFKPDNEFNIKDFIYNIYEQNKYNSDLISSSANRGVFLSDSDNMVTLMYARAYSKRNNFGIGEEDYLLLKDLTKAYRKSIRWNKIFLLPPKPKDIVDDGERYMPDSDYNIRKEFFKVLIDLYNEFGYEYEILDGDYYSNFCRVRDYIKGLYK